MSALSPLNFVGQLPPALLAAIVVVAIVGFALLLSRVGRLRRHAKGKGAQRTSEQSTRVNARALVVARVVAISESRIERERETAKSLLRRPGLGYQPQRLERRIAVLR